jgi:hypothetical protein
MQEEENLQILSRVQEQQQQKQQSDLFSVDVRDARG